MQMVGFDLCWWSMWKHSAVICRFIGHHWCYIPSWSRTWGLRTPLIFGLLKRYVSISRGNTGKLRKILSRLLIKIPWRKWTSCLTCWQEYHLRYALTVSSATVAGCEGQGRVQACQTWEDVWRDSVSSAWLRRWEAQGRTAQSEAKFFEGLQMGTCRKRAGSEHFIIMNAWIMFVLCHCSLLWGGWLWMQYIMQCFCHVSVMILTV